MRRSHGLPRLWDRIEKRNFLRTANQSRVLESDGEASLLPRRPDRLAIRLQACRARSQGRRLPTPVTLISTIAEGVGKRRSYNEAAAGFQKAGRDACGYVEGDCACLRAGRIGFDLLLDDATVKDVDGAIRVARETGVVRHHDDRGAAFVKVR